MPTNMQEINTLRDDWSGMRMILKFNCCNSTAARTWISEIKRDSNTAVVTASPAGHPELSPKPGADKIKDTG